MWYIIIKNLSKIIIFLIFIDMSDMLLNGCKSILIRFVKNTVLFFNYFIRYVFKKKKKVLTKS